MTLSIAYITCRRQPMIQWFFDSLWRECGGDLNGLKVIVVDFYAGEPGRDVLIQSSAGMIPLTHIEMKPTVWQGKHRLTSRDYFAAANARNTALCLAPDGWIAFVDDLSVLLPGWLSRVRSAMEGGYIACGTYSKVKNLNVDHSGNVVSFDLVSPDHRLQHTSSSCGPCGGQWLFGCSCALPVEWLLSINGWPEDLCDGFYGEDCLAGHVLENCGYPLRFDKEMRTLEADDLHLATSVARGEDYGQSPHDKSHQALAVARSARFFSNDLGAANIRELRSQVLAGAPFPIRHTPQHEWYTGKPLSDL